MEFIINLYDQFVNGSLMDDLLDERIDLFDSLFWILLGLILFTVLLYYYGMNRFFTRSSRFGTLGWWVIILIITVVLIFGIHLATCLQMADKLIPRNPGAPQNQVTYFFDQPDSVFFGFALQVSGLGILLFIAFSMALKWGSQHARNKPL